MIHPDQIPTDQLIGHLFGLGHFHLCDSDGFRGAGPDTVDDVLGEKRESAEVERAVRSWQGWRGLNEDGDFGPVCLESHLSEHRRCGCPDNMQRRGERSQWGDSCKLNITWAFNFDGIRYQDSAGRTLHDAWAAARAFWNRNAGCRLVAVPWEDNRTARIRSVGARLSSSTMADSFLPNNNCSEQLGQRYNTKLDWRWQTKWSTDAHEVGHALGLPHVPRNEPYALRNVMYFANNDGWDGTIGAWELREIQKRYGKPVMPPDSPTDDDDPPTTAPRFITIPQAIEPGEYELIKVLDHG